jgi:tRNA threonylcarbamoyl adenosine modification protein YeaZ
MLGLLIETSTERGLLALVKDGKLLQKADLPVGLNHSQQLMYYLEHLFTAVHLSITDLHYIAVGVGPGSYTGIRVGATVAKTLSYATKLPLIGISTLLTYTSPKPGAFAVVIDAKIGGVYLTLSDGKTVQHPPELVDLKRAVELLHPYPTLLTPNAARLPGKFKEIQPDTHWEWLECGPDPLHFARQAEAKWKEHEFTTDGQLELLYLRKTQAELDRM